MEVLEYLQKSTEYAKRLNGLSPVGHLNYLTYNDVINSFKIPQVYKDLLQNLYSDSPIDIVGVKGGRSGGKTVNLISLHAIAKTFDTDDKGKVLIVREYRNTLKELIFDIAEKYPEWSNIKNLKQAFKMVHSRNLVVNTVTGKEIIFEALKQNKGTTTTSQQSNLDKIKSNNNASLVCLEEASSITFDSLRVLMPTARADNRKVVFCFNPVREQDDVERFFKHRNDTLIKHVNMFDLEPEFQSKTALKEYEVQKQQVDAGNHDRPTFEHDWLGKPHPLLQGRPFENKPVIKEFPQGKTMHFFIDPSLKGGDYTALSIGYGEYNSQGIIDFYIGGYIWKLGIEECLNRGLIAEKIKKHQAFYGGYEDNIMGYEMHGRLPNTELVKITSSKNKEEKIYSKRINNIFLVDLEPINNNVYGGFVRQVKEYSKGVAHDDAPDSLAMLIEYLYNNVEY